MLYSHWLHFVGRGSALCAVGRVVFSNGCTLLGDIRPGSHWVHYVGRCFALCAFCRVVFRILYIWQCGISHCVYLFGVALCAFCMCMLSSLYANSLGASAPETSLISFNHYLLFVKNDDIVCFMILLVSTTSSVVSQVQCGFLARCIITYVLWTLLKPTHWLWRLSHY